MSRVRASWIEDYAAGYAEVARIQATFRQILARHGLDPSLPTFEGDFLIAKDVAVRAQGRAAGEGVDFTAVCRMTLFRAALAAEPSPDYDPARRPPLRPRAEQSRVRFSVPREPYEEAKKAIEASRRSVAHALEDELRRYAEEE